MSGVSRAARGASLHDADCGCARCAGFQPGNELSLRHGAGAVIALRPRANEIAGDLRAIVPARSDADEPTIAFAALVLARVERVANWLDEHGLLDEHGTPRPVLKVLSTSENTAARLLDRLGCTPTTRARLGLDVALAQRASDRALDALEATGRALIARRDGSEQS